MRNGIDAAVAATGGLKAETRLGSILNEIATHAEANPNWLGFSAAL